MRREEDTQLDGQLDRRELLVRAGAGGALLSVPALLAAQGATASASVASQTSARATGGTLRAAVAWGTSESIDPQAVVGTANDIMRNFALFERLAAPDANGRIKMVLAESIEGNARADRWDIRIKDGINWHDGSPFTADDVVYSLKRITTKSLGLEGYETLKMIDAKRLAKVDARTVRVQLKAPYADFLSQISDRMILMVKNGTTDFKTLNGTGPFTLGATEQGRKITLNRNPNYWVPGRPYLDVVELINLADQTAQVNALLSNQVDILQQIDPAAQKLLKGKNGIVLIDNNGGGFSALCMNVTKAPFNNPDVRKAMRLIADRPQLLQVAQNGKGQLGNDLFGRFDPLYARFKQRTADPEQAKSLLKKAGITKLVLNTADVGGGILPASVAFAQQAKAAGLSLKTAVSPGDSYWNTAYMKTPFFVTGYAQRSLLSTWGLTLAPGAPYNETAWKDAKSARLLAEAMRTVDDAKRREIMLDAQRIQYTNGGYVIYGFQTLTTAVSSKVAGVTPNVNRPINDFTFTNVSLRG